MSAVRIVLAEVVTVALLAVPVAWASARAGWREAAAWRARHDALRATMLDGGRP